MLMTKCIALNAHCVSRKGVMILDAKQIVIIIVPLKSGNMIKKGDSHEFTGFKTDLTSKDLAQDRC